MKKTLSVLFALLMSCITASAQIQNGYVRSQGTSYNRTGSPLKGARVFVKGLNGSKVTAPNGTFNFNLGGGKTQFSISSVTLKGYTLLSPLAPAYNVGKAAVEIVMQSREERIQNEARISKVIEERITKSYNAKTRELQKKITTLEKVLSDKKKNSDELETQIRSLKEQLGNLDNQYLKRNELIDKMVEEYVNLDYATMNNRKAELCSYIETGELEKADSLLNTIDINKEMNDIKTLNRDIEEKESMLAKEKEIRKNKIETACMYWRGKYDIAIQNMQYDSAAVYVKNLADVDTCNFENVFECAHFFQKQNCFKEAEEYYIKILKKVEQENNSNKNIRIYSLYNNLALLYSYTQRFKESEDMHKAAITIRERLVKENPKAY
ncbi:tetratricopeptide repeat protein, partial [Leyella stercorea]|uniref:tetratricopeptide repeat protein n=1 Tax=Leyella stercorea TaxID=363265 RepID=UPI003FEE5A38